MRLILAAVLVFAGAASAYADDSCATQSAAKKLAGAAKTSFTTKCERDSTASCDVAASGKKLAGAARTSFTKKCVRDAVGG